MKIRNLLIAVAASAVVGTAAVGTATTTPAFAQDIPNVTAGSQGLPASDVVDISSNNGHISVADFQNMRATGVKAVIVKITEYTTYRNPYASEQINNALAAGMQVGVYHYAWFTSEQEARNEATYFGNYANQLGLSKNALLVDDLEESSTKVGNVTANAAAFNNQLKAMGFTNTSIYTYPSYQSSTGLDFSFIGNDRVWMATYPYTPSSGDMRNTQYGMWQWTSRASFPNVSGQFDVSTDYKGLATGSASGQNNNASQGTSSTTGSTDIFGNLLQGLTGSNSSNGQSSTNQTAEGDRRFTLDEHYTNN